MNGEGKNQSVAPQKQAEKNGGAWIGDKKISGFLKLFKTPGRATALGRLSSDIGVASAEPIFQKSGDPARKIEVKDIFEKVEPVKIADVVGKMTVPEKSEAIPGTNLDLAKTEVSAKPETPEPEIEIISGKEGPLGTSGKTGEEIEIRRLRTYKEDVAEALKREKTTVVKMVLDEQRRKEGLAPVGEVSSKKNAILVWLSIIFLVLGGGTVAMIYVFKKNDGAAITQPGGKIVSIVFAESEKKISVTDVPSERLGKLVKTEVLGADIRLDTVENLWFTEAGPVANSKGEPIEAEINMARFWSALGIDLPPVLLRSLSDEFMVGVHAWNGNQAFIVLKNNFYENAFAGMLKWEETMAKDLLSILTNRPLSSFYGKPFQDMVIKNRDIRGIVDENGEPILLYTFVNRETVIIATHKDTLNEAMSRFLKTTVNAN